MKKFLTMVAVVSLITTSAFAQNPFRLGVTAGLEFSNMLAKYDGETLSDDLKSKTGFKFGVLGEYSFSEYFALEPGLLFTQRGFKIDESASEGGYTLSLKSTLNINYLSIPLNLKFSYPVNEDFKVFAFTGPYVGFALSGKISAEGKVTGPGVNESAKESETINIGSGDEEIRMLDLGWNFGAGVEYKGIFLRAQYNLGLANTSNPDKETTKNRNFGISVGYMFNF